MLAQNRGIIGIVLIVIVFWIYRNSRRSKKNKFIMIISIIILIIISSFRIENLFISYNSPESAFKNSGLKGNIIKTVDSKYSTLVIYTDQETSSNLVLCKEKGKWKVPLFHSEAAMKRLRDGSLLILNKEKDKDNYYILISLNNSNYKILDNKNTNFEKYELSNNKMFESLTETEYVAYVENVDENYYIEINNQKFYVLRELNL